LDTILFVSVVLLVAPGFSGLPIHEWLGLAVMPLIVVHILYGWRWIAATLLKLGEKRAWRSRVNFLLNTLQFIAFTVTIFSGAMTSFIVLPALGIAPGNFENWRTLHNQWSNVVLILAALHIAMNWSWIAGMVRRHVLARPTAQGDAAVGTLAAEPPDA
jgi:cytochrome b